LEYPLLPTTLPPDIPSELVGPLLLFALLTVSMVGGIFRTLMLIAMSWRLIKLGVSLSIVSSAAAFAGKALI
jgi:hypothetical protein